MRRAAGAHVWWPTLWAAFAACLLLASCGGGGGSEGGSGGEGGSGNVDAPPPTAVITAPAADATFAGGDTVAFAASAVDEREGALPASALTWWVDLHHDTHSHPFVPMTTGASGSVTIPTRGETSANIWYRFHLRATNGAGKTVEVVRDLHPRTATLTLASVPPGLRLTLDGQPVTAPHTVTGVVGIERGLGAADQVASGRQWRFDGWAHGGSAVQTIATPAAPATYTANFTDVGAASNQPPTVQLGAPPAPVVAGIALTLAADARDGDGSIARVDFYEGATLIGTDTTAPYTQAWTPAAAGTYALRARATDNLGLVGDSAVVGVAVTAPMPGDAVPPTATLTSPANLADGLQGTVTLRADASDDVGVAAVEFQVDGAALGSEATSAPYTATLDTTFWASGQHVLRARARDAAGNRSAWSSVRVRFGGNRDLPAGFTKNESWVTGLAAATTMAQAPDGRLFVAEQGGTVRIVKAGVLLPAPFHTFTVDDRGERGLLGVALHPNFASNGFVYVYYTRVNGGQRNNRIARIVAGGAAGAAGGDISTGAETVLADLPDLSDAVNHNGGAMKFGADGKLYVAVGDNVQPPRAQDLSDAFGKLLRFNDDGSLPGDNPFFGLQPDWGGAVWAYGLRNAFTFAVQPGTGRMHINDVGEESWEEINLGAAGANYGWPGSEGDSNIGPGVTAPLFAYSHDEASPPGSGSGGFFVGRAITGGTFYPASGPFPAALHGRYFFADYVARFIGVYDIANGAAYAFGRVGGAPVDLLAGADGALYVLTRSAIVRISTP
jgi:glucose/arabinose dehydrogenase